MATLCALGARTKNPTQRLFFAIIFTFITVTIVSATFRQADAQCPPAPTVHPNGVLEGPVTGPDENGLNSSVAIDDQDRLLVIWQSLSQTAGQNTSFKEIRVIGLTPLGDCGIPPQKISDHLTAWRTQHTNPCAAMSADGRIRVVWIGFRRQLSTPVFTRLVADFAYDQDPATWPTLLPPGPSSALGDADPSTGVSAAAADARALAWSNSDILEGIFYDTTAATPLSIRTCSDFCSARILQWQPALAMRSDGHFVVAWSDAEDDSVEDPPFDIRAQLFDAVGNPIGTEVLVNQPSIEIPLSTTTLERLKFH